MTASSCAMVTLFLLSEPDALPETGLLLLLSVDHLSDVVMLLLLLLLLLALPVMRLLLLLALPVMRLLLLLP